MKKSKQSKKRKIVNCCFAKTHKKCIRIKDKKLFTLPRKYSRKQCKKQKGFSMRSSCAPYLFCKK